MLLQGKDCADYSLYQLAEAVRALPEAIVARPERLTASGSDLHDLYHQALEKSGQARDAHDWSAVVHWDMLVLQQLHELQNNYKLERAVGEIFKQYPEFATHSQGEMPSAFWQEALLNVAEFFIEAEDVSADVPMVEAWAIGQTEMGISADTPIGTVNVHDCICVMVRDPESHKTVLAHIDSKTVRDDFAKILEPFADRAADAPMLEARLYGARQANSPGIQNYRIANDNILSVSDFLKQQQVDLLSTNVAVRNQSSAIVVDPADFSIKRACPTMTRPHSAMGAGLIFLKDQKRPLNLAFDLTKERSFLPFPIEQIAEEFSMSEMIKENAVVALSAKAMRAGFSGTSVVATSLLMRRQFEQAQRQTACQPSVKPSL